VVWSERLAYDLRETQEEHGEIRFLEYQRPVGISLIEIKQERERLLCLFAEPAGELMLDVVPQFHRELMLYAETDTPSPVIPGTGLTDTEITIF
jgi:hypothetical protein